MDPQFTHEQTTEGILPPCKAARMSPLLRLTRAWWAHCKINPLECHPQRPLRNPFLLAAKEPTLDPQPLPTSSSLDPGLWLCILGPVRAGSTAGVFAVNLQGPC